MNIPTSTYRIQLSSTFDFKSLGEIVDYLEALGISTIYAAPFFQAREGSTHGYDVVDPLRINHSIGSTEDFKSLRATLKRKGMSWLQDIVPNHMAFDGQNPWLSDIFELGPKSPYYNFFDINWDYKGWGKVMAPFLGDPIEKVLNNSELRLNFTENGLRFEYFDLSYPASMQTYTGIFAQAGTAAYNQALANIENDTGSWPELKHSICSEIAGDDALMHQLQSTLDEINGSPKQLTAQLEHQYFKPTFWKHTEEEINYRRFFTVNDLICLRMDDPQVFSFYHDFIESLCVKREINGLRVDHIDGLFDPENYLNNLHRLVGEDFYVIAEKILEKGEKLPLKWTFEGTSGYEFLASVNQLLTENENERHFNSSYAQLVPELPDYETLVYQKKRFIFKQRMGGELQNLINLLHERELMPAENWADDELMKEALTAFLAAFPVYRIYPDSFPLDSEEGAVIEYAFAKANKHAPEFPEALRYLESLFLGKASKEVTAMLYFLKRCQQFTGPLAAKGGEDTSFYIYNRLISHNEVGDSPEHFGVSIADFHKEMDYRKRHFPHALSATATHDTKRGEDARMRLSVLSEIPAEWFALVDRCNAIAEKIRTSLNTPTINETYFIYQTLLGALPSAEAVDETFLERTKDYLQKAAREAKVNTNWADPDLEHEQAVFKFVKDLLANPQFNEVFTPFFEKVKRLGALKSLSQTLIKLTAPGVPDIYQGTEGWDLSYVDPDNRRPVDFELCKANLETFSAFSQENSSDKLHDLNRNFHDGRIKMYVLYRGLQLRKTDAELFLEGDYLPLEITGKAAKSFMAFARIRGDRWSITLVPVLVNAYFKSQELLPDAQSLAESELILPENTPENLFNHFTLERLNYTKKVSLNQLFNQFPVALLSNTQAL